MEFINTTVEELKSNIENKVDKQVFEVYKKDADQKIDDLKKRIDDYKAEITCKTDDLENRSKRKNLVYGTFQKVKKEKCDNPQRPVHVRFLNRSDKDYVIRKALKSSKSNKKTTHIVLHKLT